MFRKLTYFIVFTILLFVIWLPVPDAIQHPDFSRIVKDHSGRILRVELNGKEQWLLPPEKGETIPGKLKKCVLMAEDRWFYLHPGINPVSVLRAIRLNLKHRKIVSGASTITMQLIRIADPAPRTYGRKLYESMAALKLELLYSKDEILKKYLMLAPYGSNIKGYKAASYKFFAKWPHELSWGEAALLAVLPNEPGHIFPGRKKRKLLRKRNNLLKKLYQYKVIDSLTYKLSSREELPSEIHPFPFHAPHFTRRVLENTRDSIIIQTPLDLDIQERVEWIVRNYQYYINSIGIPNLAVLVAERKTGKVRAYLGSQNYFDEDNQGKVDGVIAPRSPGSTLKPFLYALAMDRGYVVPQSLVRDVPTFYGAYSPENADHLYRGVVTVKDALIASLNVPAVRMLNKLGVRDFYLFLKENQPGHLFRSYEDYGLTLILGGGESSLEELVRLYVMLGNYGLWKPLVIFKNQRSIPAKRMLSKGAAWLTLNMMTDVKRPGIEYYLSQWKETGKIAWKTGTSFGHRDAWAIGINADWVVGVWCGDFRSTENPLLTGHSAAGPLLFKIFNGLPELKNETWLSRPDKDLKPIEICAKTGYRAGELCIETEIGYQPKDAPPLTICPFHHLVYLDEEGKHELCSLCWENQRVQKDTLLLFPPDVIQYRKKMGYNVAERPMHNPQCPTVHQNQITIIYPQNNSKIILPRDFNRKRQKLIVRAASELKNDTFFWFLDHQYIGQTRNRHEKAIDVPSGMHRLMIVNSRGQNQTTVFSVEY